MTDLEMEQPSMSAREPFDWREERLRYQVLQFIYDRLGSRVDECVSGLQVGTALGLGFDEVLRVVTWLDRHGYAHDLGGIRVCVAPRGIEYLRSGAKRRRSLRD